jgi:hypothetical protein
MQECTRCKNGNVIEIKESKGGPVFFINTPSEPQASCKANQTKLKIDRKE